MGNFCAGESYQYPNVYRETVTEDGTWRREDNDLEEKALPDGQSIFAAMTTKPMVVAVDIDDTLLLTTDVFKQWADSKNNGPLFTHRQDYLNELGNFSSCWREDFMQSGLFEDLPPVPGSKQGLKALQNAGWTLHVVTARQESSWRLTKGLLDRLFPSMFSNLSFVGSGLGKKGAVCQRIGAIVLIDDCMNQLRDAMKYGVDCVLFDLQGTYGSSMEPSLGVTRLESWEDVSQWIIARYQTATAESENED